MLLVVVVVVVDDVVVLVVVLLLLPWTKHLQDSMFWGKKGCTAHVVP